MTTLPPESGRLLGHETHQARQVAESFGAAKLDELLAGIGAAVEAAGGGFTMRYTTVVVTAASG